MDTPKEEFGDQESLEWPDIFMKGDDIQKLSVIQSLPNLLQTDQMGTMSRVIPKIQQELPLNNSTEFQLVSSKIFKVLIEMKLDMNLLRPVFAGVESKDPIVAYAWIETLLEVMHGLLEPVIKQEVLPFASKISQLNRPLFYRVNSCKLLGQIAIHPKISTFDVKKDVVPLTQSLCQDCLYEVRAAMCVELPNVAKGLVTDQNIRVCLLPCLVELSSDDNMQVRAAAVNAAVLIIPFLNVDTIKGTAIPLVKRLCVECGKEGDQTYPTVAKIYGQLLTNLQVHLSEVDSLWFLDTFKELSRRGLTMANEDLDVDPGMALTCRESCAFNLPAVTFFTFTQIPQEMSKWHSIFKELANDPCYIVRKTVACSIHEITKILGKDGKVIFPDFLKLIRDDAEEVLDVLVPNISSTLLWLSNWGFLSKEVTSQATLDLGRALLKCHTEVFKCHNWRRRTVFLQQLESLPMYMPSDFIHQHFSPIIMKLTMDARARPVRTQSAITLLVFLRYNGKENHRKWIRETLINSLCESSCCYTRHIFINMCMAAIQIFSWKYFKEHFYLPLLTLGAPYAKGTTGRDASRRQFQQQHSNSTRGSLSSDASSATSAASVNEMSFLEQHFYIDAGVILPDTTSNASLPSIENNMSRLTIEHSSPTEEIGSTVSVENTDIENMSDEDLIVSTVSVENTNIENMSDEDLIELKTSTTNITDDVKVNIEKKAAVSKLRTYEGVVEKRNKRNSCLFTSDINQRDKKLHMKRRSLNIATSEISRIPVITKCSPQKTSLPKNKVETKQNEAKSKLGSSKLNKLNIKTDNGDESQIRINSNVNMCNKDDNKYNRLRDKDVKENVPITNSINEISPVSCNRETRSTKTSNLPVLKRRLPNR